MSATLRIKMQDSNGNDVNQDLAVLNTADNVIKRFCRDYQKLTENTVTGAARRPDFEDVDID